MLSKYFQNFGGINFRTPELLKGNTVATDMKNVRLSENFGLSKRRGYQHLLRDVGGNGRVIYNNVDLDTGVNNPEDLVADATLKRVLKNNVIVFLRDPGPITGEEFTSQFVLDTNTNTFKLYLRAESVEEIYDLGTGKEDTPYTILDLNTDMQITDRFSIIADNPNMPAAFIKTGLEQFPVNNDTFHFAEYVEEIPSVDTLVPFENHWAAKDTPDWEINSFVQLNDVLYITNKNDGLMKYDGERIYKAGLPKPATPTNTPSGAAINWKFRVLFKHIDAKDNVTLSEISESLQVDLNDPTIVVDTTNIWQKGYDTDATRFEVELYRTVNDGAVFYLVDTQSVAGNSVSFDNEDVADSTLQNNIEFLFPFRNPAPPPKCSYATAFRNYLVLTGDPTAVNTVYFSDLEATEGFDLRNSFITGSRFGNANSGVKELDNSLYIFKPQSVFMFNGDIAAGIENCQVDTLADDGVGCVSHNSIVEAYGNLYFLAPNGIYSVSRKGLKAETDDITPLFVRPNYKENRAISFYWPIENKIMFMLPISDNGNARPESRILVKDIISNSWFVWDNWDFSGGIALNGTDLVYSSREYSGQILDLKSPLDYADHEQPINFSYSSHWEALGEPAVYKKFLKVKCYTLDSVLQTFDSSNFNLDIRTQFDYNDTDIASTSMQFGAAEGEGYGFDSWGEFEYGDIKKLEETRRLAARRCRCIRIIFNNNIAHENVLISGFELEYSAPYSQQLKGGK